MTHFVYDPPKGDYWSVPSMGWVMARYPWRTFTISWSSPLENYYFWLGKDGEVDARG